MEVNDIDEVVLFVNDIIQENIDLQEQTRTNIRQTEHEQPVAESPEAVQETSRSPLVLPDDDDEAAPTTTVGVPELPRSKSGTHSQTAEQQGGQTATKLPRAPLSPNSRLDDNDETKLLCTCRQSGREAV